MIDVVQLFADQATALGLDFDFGTRAMTNLLASDSVSDRVYLRLESPIRWSRELDTFGAGKAQASGRFLLVVKSDLDNVVYQQKGKAAADGKYVKNVLPLLTHADGLLTGLIGCSDIEVTSWSAIDGYNMLDTNTDGLIVEFSLTEV